MQNDGFYTNYWMDFAFFLIQWIEYCSSDRCHCIKRMPAAIKLLIRMIVGFLIDILAIGATAAIYGLDFHDANGNLNGSWIYICTLIYVVVWSCFTMLSIVLLVLIVRDKVKDKWRCLTIYTISKLIGMINSGAIFYVIILYISKTKAALVVTPQGLEGLFLTYATLDFLLNLAEIPFQLIVSCCYDEDVRSNT